jgi:DNA modification methylase
MGSLYFGDNLNILRDEIKSESVNLVYLDPPFNSKRDYNLLFKTPKGHDSDAQITAFDDTWRWGEQAEREFDELLHQGNTDVAEMIQSLRRFLKESDMMAYLVMMANRLVELHRVLKPTGSLYLHCDPTASHYLKVVLDTIFGTDNFVNEIVWKRRQGMHNSSRRFGVATDSIFLYAKSEQFTFNKQFGEHDPKYLEKHFRYQESDGRRYTIADLSNPADRPNLKYSYKGYPPPAKGWAISLEKMKELDEQGKLYFPPDPKGHIRRKRYLDDMEGQPIASLWDDIFPINSQAQERLGYPTQKPLALLERIIQASSNEGEIVLDPFCGCGTAVHAAQVLKREWIGIDITHLAISLIEKRMKDAFPNITFEIHGTPKDLDGAKDLAARDKYQFQWWACSLVNAQPYQGKKKGADGGTDGIIFFQDDEKGAKKIIVSVKGGENVTRTMIADLKNTVEREKAEIGLFVTLAEATKPMITEAVSAGFYESPHMGAFPKIQILTIADLLSGKSKPNYPDLSRGGLSFKKAKTEQQRVEQNKMEGF